MKFPFVKEKKQAVLILDIGTEAIKALIMEKGIVLGVGHHYLTSNSKGLETLNRSILRAAAAAQDKAKTVSTSVILSLPEDISKTRVLLQSYRRTASKKIISAEEEAAIYKKIFAKSKKEIQQQISERSGIMPEDILFINFKILETKIDGYSVSALKGLTGRDLEFNVLIISLLKYMEKYGDCGFEFLKKNIEGLGWNISKIAEPLQNLAGVNKANNALYLDVGGLLTQLIMIENKQLKKIEEFKIGGQNFTHGLAQTLGISLARARILKHKYAKKMLSEPARERIREILVPYVHDWFNALKEKLMAGNNLIPENIFLLGGGSSLPEIKEILADGDWGDLYFPDQIKIKHVCSQDLDLASSADLNDPQFIPSLLLYD